jgi:hypothetical protein
MKFVVPAGGNGDTDGRGDERALQADGGDR